MRGKAHRAGLPSLSHGITPAHAGKSTLPGCCCRLPEDHPRACGEKRLSQALRSSYVRITPAHAGKSPVGDQFAGPEEDHPRACGEKTKKIPYYRLFPLRSAPFSFSFA